MKVLIIEDEQPAAKRLLSLLQEIGASIQVLDVLDSVEDAVDWFRSNPEPDLVFLDIHLADGLSFEIFKQIKLWVPIIFTTAYDEFAIKSFEVNSLAYLLKPIDKLALESALKKHRALTEEGLDSDTELPWDKLLDKLSNPIHYANRFLVRYADRLISIPNDKVAYFRADGKTVMLFTVDGKTYLYEKTLEELERKTDPRAFFRLNRKFLVHIQSVADIFLHFNSKLKVELLPSQEEEVYVSKEKASTFKRWLDG